MANGSRRSHRASALSKLNQRGMLASRDHGGDCFVDYYKDVRRMGATASEAYMFAKEYRQSTQGDYYR